MLGNGFDFLEALVSNGYWGLSILAILYVIFSAIILLNGLIGIFGYAFSTEDDSTNVTFLTAKQGLAETRVLQAKLDDLITKLNMK